MFPIMCLLIDALPLNTHPMTMYVVGVMALQTESYFAKKYSEGINKKDYWEPVFDDAMILLARLPRIAAYIYRRKYKNNEHIHPNGLLDWTHKNFAIPNFSSTSRFDNGLSYSFN